jgi:hypothetical protein
LSRLEQAAIGQLVFCLEKFVEVLQTTSPRKSSCVLRKRDSDLKGRDLSTNHHA